MEDYLKTALNSITEELEEKFAQIIDNAESLEVTLSRFDTEDILESLDPDDVAEWLDGRRGWRTIDFHSNSDMEGMLEELQAELGYGPDSVIQTANARPWRNDCIDKFNDLAEQWGWQELLNKLEQLKG
jgi:cupin superfamily acireductone dioxygenase involved in methionine salvage